MLQDFLPFSYLGTCFAAEFRSVLYQITAEQQPDLECRIFRDSTWGNLLLDPGFVGF